MPPRVSVLMAVFNGERFLRLAIDSILAQTFTDFEFVIVDDGSTDDTPHILRQYQQRDARIRLLRQPANAGVFAALNLGCAAAQGEFIARIDADDLSLPERLEKQVRFLDRHPSLGMVGSASQMIDEHGQFTADIPAISGAALLRWLLVFDNRFVSSSVMMRREAAAQQQFYAAEFKAAGDYDLWARISLAHPVDNLPEPLAQYRVWGSSISFTKTDEQRRRVSEVSQRLMQHYAGRPVAPNVNTMLRRTRNRSVNPLKPTLAEIQEAAQTLDALHAGFQNAVSLSESEAAAVSLDAALRTFSLALEARRLSPAAALRLAWKAVQSNPALLVELMRVIGRKLKSRWNRC